MSKEKNYVLKPIEVTDEHLENILIGAFEGGSEYWADNVAVKDGDYKGKKFASECVAAGGELYIHTTEGDKYLLTKNMLINGLQRYLNESKHKNWPDGGDSMTDDVILQYALFEEVVYG